MTTKSSVTHLLLSIIALAIGIVAQPVHMALAADVVPAVAQAEAEMAPVSQGNTGCEPVGTSVPTQFDYNFWPCPQVGFPVSLDYTALSPSGAYSLLGNCPDQSENPSYYIHVEFVMCDEGDASGDLVGFEFPSGPEVMSIPFENTNEVSSPCFDSCDWPLYWELQLDDTVTGVTDVYWYVGCCTCSWYSDPCM